MISRARRQFLSKEHPIRNNNSSGRRGARTTLVLLVAAFIMTLGATKSRAATVQGTIGDGLPDFSYDPASGDVRFLYDGGIAAGKLVQEIRVRSASGLLLPSNANLSLAELYLLTSTDLRLQNITDFFPDGYDMGAILPANENFSVLLGDLTLTFIIKGQAQNGGGFFTPSDLVPAPTPLTSVPLPSVGWSGIALFAGVVLQARFHRPSRVSDATE